MVEKKEDISRRDLTPCEIKFPSDSDQEDILTELEELHVSYTELFFEVRKKIDHLVEEKFLALEDLILKIKCSKIF